MTVMNELIMCVLSVTGSEWWQSSLRSAYLSSLSYPTYYLHRRSLWEFVFLREVLKVGRVCDDSKCKHLTISCWRKMKTWMIKTKRKNRNSVRGNVNCRSCCFKMRALIMWLNTGARFHHCHPHFTSCSDLLSCLLRVGFGCWLSVKSSVWSGVVPCSFRPDSHDAPQHMPPIRVTLCSMFPYWKHCQAAGRRDFFLFFLFSVQSIREQQICGFVSHEALALQSVEDQGRLFTFLLSWRFFFFYCDWVEVVGGNEVDTHAGRSLREGAGGLQKTEVNQRKCCVIGSGVCVCVFI